MPLRAEGADAIRRKVAQPPHNAKTFAADIRRRQQRQALFATSIAHASETNPKSVYRSTPYLASTPDPNRYFTPQEIAASPPLKLLTQNRRAAIADMRGQRFDRNQVQKVQTALGMAHVPHAAAQKLGQIIGGAGLAAAYSPAGAWHLATTNPARSVPELAVATVDPLVHPVRYWRNDPFALLSSAFAVGAGGASLVARAGAAAGAARAAESAGGRAALKAALRRPGGGMRTIYHDGEQTRALNTGSAIGTALGKVSDRVLGLNRPDPWTLRKPTGKVVKPAEYRTETVQLPNPAHRQATHEANVAQAALEQQQAQAAQAQKLAGKAAGKGETTTITHVEVRPRSAADVTARLKAVQDELAPYLKQLEAYYKELKKEQRPMTEGQRKIGDRYMTEADKAKGIQSKRGRKTFTGKVEATGSRAADEEAAAAFGRTSQYRTGRNFKTIDPAAEAEKAIERAGSARGADPRMRRLLMLLQERDSLTSLLSKHQAAALFPEDVPKEGFGAEIRFKGARRGAEAHAQRITTGTAALARLQEAAARARAGLPGAETAAAEARAAAGQIPSHVPAQRQRLVSAEVRSTPPDLLRPGRAAARWAAGHKFRSEQMQEERLRLAQQLREQSLQQGKTRRALRSVNRGSRMALLYSKLGYIPSNVVSQEIMSLIQQGVYMPYNRIASAQLRGTKFGAAMRRAGVNIAEPLSPQALKDAREAAGSGRVLSGMAPHPAPTVSEKVLARIERSLILTDDKMGQLFGMVVDDPYRMAALVHELRRHGIKPRDIETMLKKAGAHEHDAQMAMRYRGQVSPADAKRAYEIANEASRRANRAMIDYARMGKGFRNIRDLVFIAPWVKGATHYTMQFPLEHPAQTAAITALGQTGRRHTGLAPNQPSITAGSFQVGSRQTPLGRMPVVINPGYVNTLKQPFDTGRAVASFFPGLTGVHASKYNSIADVLQPLYGEALSEAEKGKLSLGSILKGFGTSIPPYRLFQGLLHPATKTDTFKLYPRNQQDAINQWLLGSIAAKPQNPMTAQSIYRTEQSTGATPQQRIDMKAQWLNDLVPKLNRLRAATGQPPLTASDQAGIASMIDMTHRHQLARLTVENEFPQFHQVGKRHALDERGELIASMLAAQGDTPQTRARIAPVVAQLERAGRGWTPPPELKAAIRQTFASEQKLRWLINKANTASAAKLPYTQGGAPISMPSK